MFIMRVFHPPAPVPRYNHPVHDIGPGVFHSINEVESLYHEPRRVELLQRALGGLPFEAMHLVDTLRLLSLRESTLRATHEQATTHTALGLNLERFNEYKEKAGKPELLPEFIDYFARLSSVHRGTIVEGTYKGPSLSLGYEIQAGVWDGVHAHNASTIGLDEAARCLPEQFAATPLSADYQFVVRTGRERELSYKAIPVATAATEGVELILLTRKRAIADILTRNGRKLEIAKRACAMAIIEGLPERARDNVREALATLQNPDPDRPLSDGIARTVGTVFEFAKQRENRDTDGHFMGILPESMTYFIRERINSPA